MAEKDSGRFLEAVPAFGPELFPHRQTSARIGSGSPGAKARGLATMRAILEDHIAPTFLPEIRLTIPPFVVMTSEFFDLFMQQNELHDLPLADAEDDVIARAFSAAVLPGDLVETLRSFLVQMRTPVAVRPSSVLEDSDGRSFSRLYGTRMLPNNESDPAERLARLLDAIRYVYASTYFRRAKNVVQDRMTDEKVAVILQEAVGSLHGTRFYPHISGVARSLNFYPTGLARPDEGVVHLALGLGRAIADDGVGWSYSPAHPQVNPPYNCIDDLLDQTQKEFWAINMESRNLTAAGDRDTWTRCTLEEAEQDGTLRFVASTYKAQDDRIVPGIQAQGPRIVDFAPVLKYEMVPLNRLLKTLLKAAEDVVGGAAEIEFAATLSERSGAPARFGFLQIRPMIESQTVVDVSLEDLSKANVLLASESVLGNGEIRTLCDIVYVKPDRFQPRHTRTIAGELESLDRDLVGSGREYVLIGFGRWGTTDPQCGIPVAYDQIRGAKVLIEATLPNLHVMLSHGVHFFHHIVGSRTVYFSVEPSRGERIDWGWLSRQPVVTDTELVRHVTLASPLLVRVDGRQGRGVIYREP